MKNAKLLVLFAAIIVLAGCGAKKKQLMNSISKGMHKHEIKLKMGEPAEVSRVKSSSGQEVDVWEYRLATVDENQKSKRVAVAVVSSIFFWPGLFALPCMDSQYSYDNYYVEFQNNHVCRWGKSCDLGLERMQRAA
jgi:hypothetical protein